MAIDRRKIIDEMSKITIIGDRDGVIQGFKVCVNVFPAQFWNGFAERLVQKVNEDQLEAVEFLLINAAHECGYHTGHGIITSDEWNKIVGPMVETTEDVLHGAFAVFTAWGWAQIEIVELIPNERMVIRAYDYYEADTVKIGKRDRHCAFMLQGITGAFMDLAYGGAYDKTGKTGMWTFKTIQTKGKECGDDYGEFIVTRT
ncbi:MAG TPA: hypothetical protein VN372_05415 [Methanospirillum sp.]|nr:hypothetical protein [Methanospirillum sp.]